MSQSPPESQLTFEEKDAQRQARLAELEPALSSLALQGENAYELLRPRAAHVSAVPLSHPLRHQQVRGNVIGSRNPVDEDYLMIRLGENHSLILHKDVAPGSEYAWKFVRSKAIGELASQETRITESETADDHGLGIEVSNYRYPEKIGHNPMFDYSLSSYFNNYAKAEEFIEEFETDLDDAVERFG